jgi:hypothetical protein
MLLHVLEASFAKSEQLWLAFESQLSLVYVLGLSHHCFHSHAQ